MSRPTVATPRLVSNQDRSVALLHAAETELIDVLRLPAIRTGAVDLPVDELGSLDLYFLFLFHAESGLEGSSPYTRIPGLAIGYRGDSEDYVGDWCSTVELHPPKRCGGSRTRVSSWV